MSGDGDDLLAGVDFTITRSHLEDTPLYELAKGMAASFGYSAELSLDPRLAELLRLRVAQLDPCAYCLVLHHRVAHRMGIHPDAIAALPAWRDSDLFTASERAALRYCEALTRYDVVEFPGAHAELSRYFDERQVAEIASVVINMAVWTRLKLAQGAVPSAAEDTDGLPAGG